MSKIYFITGTSSGFGRHLAEAVLARGDSAVITARKPESVQELVSRYPNTALALRLDVTDATERESTIQQALERFGRIDVLVNNAGYGSLGALEEFSEDQLRSQFEVNVWGAIGMMRAVLPSMRERKSGHILNVTSIGGLSAMRGFSLYCASKFALEGVSEALADEVKELDIKVTIVEPGAFRTEFSGDSNVRPENPIEEYAPILKTVQDYLYGSAGKQPGDPRKAALAMIEAVESDSPPLRLLLGADAYELYGKTSQQKQADFDAWRSIGENTAFEDAQAAPIGG